MVLLCFYSLFNTGGVMPNSFPLLCDVTVFKSVNEIKMVIKGFISPSTVSMDVYAIVPSAKHILV